MPTWLPLPFHPLNHKGGYMLPVFLGRNWEHDLWLHLHDAEASYLQSHSNTQRTVLISRFCLFSMFNAGYAVQVRTDNAFSFWSTILPDTSRKSRQKTRTVAKTTNPVFNHTMVYDGFRPEDLKEACIELTVWDHNKLANHFLGGLRIGLGTGAGQLIH